MKQKALFIGLLFLLLPCLAAGLSIKELTANPSTVQEATAVSFNATISGAGGENYSLEWDFGDGIVSSSPHSHSMHSFYIEGLGKEQEFTVTLRAKNSSKVISEKSVKVKVKRSEFKPTLLELTQFPKGAEEKDANHTITIHFLDAFGQGGEVRQENGSLKFVSFSDANQSLRMPLQVSALVKDKEIKLAPYKGKSVARHGALVGIFESDNSFNCIELLEINAKLAGVEKHFSIPLFFKPQEIALKEHSTPLFFPGRPIGKVSFTLALNSVQPKKGSFTVQLFTGNTLKESKQLSFKGTSWSAFLDYAPTEYDIIQGVKLLVSGTDSHGNILGRLDSSGNVTEHGAQITLSQLPADSPFKIEVMSPSARELGFGESAAFTAKLVTENNAKPENARVELENTALGLKKELEWNGEFFSTAIKMPKKASADQKFYFHAYAELNGKKHYSYTAIKIRLSKKIKIKFDYPKEGITEIDSNNAKLQVKLLYPDNSPLTEPRVMAFLSLDGQEKEVTLTLDPEKQEYGAELSQLNPGKHTLSLALMVPFEGTSTISTTLVKPVWPLVLGAAAILVIAAFLVFVIVSRKKEKQREKIALQNRLAGIEKQLKAAKVDYFKRKLTDAQYRERVLKLQQEREQILKKKK